MLVEQPPRGLVVDDVNEVHPCVPVSNPSEDVEVYGGFPSLDASGVVPSPMPTELEVSSAAEVIMDSPMRECHCDQLEMPDRQLESFEQDHMCGYCEEVRNSMDEVETETEGVGLEALSAEISTAHVTPEGKVFEDKAELSPKPKFRRLRRLIEEPVMVDSPEPIPDESHCSSPTEILGETAASWYVFR